MHLTRRTLARRERASRRGRALAQACGKAGAFIDRAVDLPEGKSRLAAFAALLAALFQAPVPARAAGQDPAGVVGRTTDFLLNLLMGVGICFIAFGVLSLAISFQSHDDSQKSKAVMAIMGGAIAVSVRYVIQIVAPNAGITV